MKRNLRIPAFLLALIIIANGVSIAFGQNSDEWEVKVTNLTSGQPFSPPLWATHNNKVDMWSVGEQATNGLAFIAEDANAMPLMALLNTDDNVNKARLALPPPEPPMPPPILPGANRTFTVETKGSEDLLSMVWMLVRTNDAFSGVDSVKLNNDQTIEVYAYDAGSEMNNERAAFIPGPPFNRMGVRDPDAQLIKRHAGIVDKTGDLTEFAWDAKKPVARIEIKKK